MQSRGSIFAIFLCLISASASANSPDGSFAKPIAIICAGITATNATGGFELACQIHEQDQITVFGGGLGEAPTLSSVREKPVSFRVSECDKPGDVFEQGICLN